LSEEVVLSLLDASHDRWKNDREGWVTLEHDGISWRVHYRHGELLEVGWWRRCCLPGCEYRRPVGARRGKRAAPGGPFHD
jgi:hypothetical protein